MKRKEIQEKMKKSGGRGECYMSFFTFNPSEEEGQVCTSTSVTDGETGSSDTRIIFQKADSEVFSPREYSESLVFLNQPLGQSILMMTEDVSLLGTDLYRSNLMLTSPSVPMKNLWEGILNMTTTMENRKMAAK